jgi:hypothetical protein
MRKLESRLSLLWAIKTRKPKEVVKERFINYCEEYDELGGRTTVEDKIRHREIFGKYAKYMDKNN